MPARPSFIPPTVNENHVAYGSNPLSREARAHHDSVQLTPEQVSVAWAMAFSDATVQMSKAGAACIKFEQGASQKTFLYGLWSMFMSVSWLDTPRVRYDLHEVGPDGKPAVKSYWFKTWSSKDFAWLRNALYANGVKTYISGMVDLYLTEQGFAFILMADGSRHKRDNVMTIAIHNLTVEAAERFNSEVNTKFGLHGSVRLDSSHGNKPYIYYPAVDRPFLRRIGLQYFIDYGHENKVILNKSSEDIVWAREKSLEVSN
jgi:hypothetical protein